jgi:preprotein translocase subunit SecY
MSYIDLLTGGAFSRATIFSMSVTPYINASIIIQLLCVAITPLGKLAKEGEVGRKQLAQITRYTTIGLGLMQGFFYYIYLRNSGVVEYTSGLRRACGQRSTIIAVFSAGATH